MKDFSYLELQVLEIDERIRPIANRPVDLTNPDWMTLARSRPHPLDEAGVRHATESLLEELVREYQQGTEGDRRAIRKIFAEYRAFSWAAQLPGVPQRVEEFRQRLVLFSMKDQGTDTRDAIVELRGLCAQARDAGIDLNSTLREVAEFSSEQDKYGMGSTRQLLLSAVEEDLRRDAGINHQQS